MSSRPTPPAAVPASQESNEDQTHGPDGQLRQRLWVNRRGFHSNNVESVFNLVKKWARMRNGVLPRKKFMHLYLSGYMFRHNKASLSYPERCMAALKCVVAEEEPVEV